MKKTLIEGIIVLVLVGVLGGLVYLKKPKTVSAAPACPLDTMACPDGSTVERSGVNCEFGVCKQELPSYMQPISKQSESITATSTSNQITNTEDISSLGKASVTVKTPVTEGGIMKRIKESAASIIKELTTTISSSLPFSNSKTSIDINPTNKQTSQADIPTSKNISGIDETHYTIKNGEIVDENNNVIYTIPIGGGSSGVPDSWTTHLVDVVPVNQTIAPIIGAIPVTGLPGKYYLSENSFGSVENCEFSNRIYILDTHTDQKTLMYEENNTTIGREDIRSCTSEIYLLATEAEKLILKYHTIGTDSVCDSTWSEPENIWYLDITKLEAGMRRYVISGPLYSKAEQEETQCRLKYEATSTPQQGAAG
jgi:hypothetical protein